ncbi:MAG: Biopolymer transport protein ExbD [Lentisphaerae bacterium ADurb.BinA184]|nr:MAG: Biopolymer transport protein ExbD [Lentisphaerae bacterium ADurb.BinA184]
MDFRKRLAGPHVSFQMAPMVDVMFLLLTFFMVAAIEARWETKLDLTMPTATSGQRPDRQPGEIIINVDKDGRIFIGESEMTVERLGRLLGDVAKEYKDQPVIIRADAKTAHEHVVAVLDVCRQVDIWNVAFAALPKPPEPAGP